MEIAATAARDGQARYQQATENSLGFSGLKDLSSKIWHDQKNLSFSSCLVSRKSLRAMNYEPRRLAVERKIRSGAYATIGDVLQRPPFRPNRFSRIDAEPGSGVQLVGQREMFHLAWDGRWISWIGIPSKEEVVPPPSTIAVACIGTLGEQEVYGRSVRVRPGQSRFALSDNVLQLRIDQASIPPGYVFALLRSETYFRIFRCLSVGGKQQVLHPDLLRQVPIPLIRPEEMSAVDKLVCEGDHLLDLAVQYEREAISLVERSLESKIK
jgi:type I restriction enzyme S subunit